MKVFRKELKFEENINNIPAIESRLSGILTRDLNSNSDGYYKVRSLYFDSYNDTSANAVQVGSTKKFKYRIRYYDSIDTIHLERKDKYNGLCKKQSCKISIDEYNKILNNDVYDLMYCTDRPLLAMFAKDIVNKHFRPKVIIDYDRLAYINPILNVRVTADVNICASKEFDKFLSGEYINIPIQDKDLFILEVKYNYILPSYIKKIVTQTNMLRQSFSKYYLGRAILQKEVNN